VRALRVHDHGEPGVALRLDDDVPVPEPGAGELRVHVGAAALGLPDVLLSRGTYQLKPPTPFTPGLEAAGEVVAVGVGVDRALVGRRVVGVPALPHGALAEQCTIPAHNAYLVPDDVDDVAAAATHIAATTAHLGLHRRAHVQAGETLVVHAGAGGTGAAAIQVGVIAGARVIATAGGADRAAVCRELGAEVAVDYTSDDIAARVRDATGGHGADVIFDPVGGDVFHASRHCIAPEGRIVLVGFASGDVPQIPANQVLFRNYSVLGLYVGAYTRDAPGRQLVESAHADVMAWLRDGRLHALVWREIRLPDAPGALEDLRDRKVVGRVVVRP
jgi:NADPH2:quinone reductase